MKSGKYWKLFHMMLFSLEKVMFSKKGHTLACSQTDFSASIVSLHNGSQKLSQTVPAGLQGFLSLSLSDWLDS